MVDNGNCGPAYNCDQFTNTDAPGFCTWINPLNYVKQVYGASSTQYAFWFNATGGYVATVNVDLDSLCANAQSYITAGQTDPCSLIRSLGVNQALLAFVMYDALFCFCTCSDGV